MYRSTGASFLDDAPNHSNQQNAQGPRENIVFGEYESLRPVLLQLYESFEENDPVIPDELIRHHLKKVGCSCPDDNVVRFIALSVCTTLDKIMKRARVPIPNASSSEGSLTMQSLEQALPIMRDSLVRKS